MPFTDLSINDVPTSAGTTSTFTTSKLTCARQFLMRTWNEKVPTTCTVWSVTLRNLGVSQSFMACCRLSMTSCRMHLNPAPVSNTYWLGAFGRKIDRRKWRLYRSLFKERELGGVVEGAYLVIRSLCWSNVFELTLLVRSFITALLVGRQ